jgi:hypothetical protein
MANNCYNHASLCGSKEALDLIELRVKEATQVVDHLWYETFYQVLGLHLPEQSKDTYDEFGSRWFRIELDRNSDDMLVISGDSAWSPVSEFFLKLSETYKLSIESAFDEPGADFGGWYDCENGVVLKDVTTDYRSYCYKEDSSALLVSLTDDIECGEYDDELDDPFSAVGEVWYRMSESDKDYIREALNERKEDLAEQSRPDTLDELEN